MSHKSQVCPNFEPYFILIFFNFFQLEVFKCPAALISIIQHLLRFLQPHWSILHHMTCAKSTIERHHSPAVQLQLILSHHCTLTSLTMYKVYCELSEVTMQWCEWINRNCTPRNNKHKAWYAHGARMVCCLLNNSARSLSAISSIKNI